MKPTRLRLAAILVLAIAAPVHAQSEQGRGVFDGIQSSVNEWMDDAAEEMEPVYREAVRFWSLAGSDIRLWMKAEDDGTDGAVGLPFVAWEEDPSEASLYAEFDRDNLAMSMRVQTSESDSRLWIFDEKLESNQEAKDFTMYFDRTGTVYVPTENGGYIPVNIPDMLGRLSGAMQISIDRAIESGVAEMLDRLGAFAARYMSTHHLAFPEGMSLPEGLRDLIREYASEAEWNNATGEYEFDVENGGETEERLRQFQQSIEDWARTEFEEIGAFPPLIHFAYIYSPAAVRSQIDVREETLTWRGLGDCTKMTVASGKDQGYIFVFDKYGRLVHLRHTNGSTATYGYDKDVTVP